LNILKIHRNIHFITTANKTINGVSFKGLSVNN